MISINTPRMSGEPGELHPNPNISLTPPHSFRDADPRSVVLC
jgi:hypothetical protein